MDQQRLQAYMGLIAQLLGCPQGQEEELLQANRELVDAGLLTVMEQVAAHLENQKSINSAQRLRGLAAQLAQTLGLGTAAPIGAGEARQFLLEMLQLVADSQGNPQQIYPVWAQQQTRFNAEVLAAFPTVAAELLEGNPEQQTVIAAVLGTFGNLIQQFPLGTRWLNLELGIAAYEQTLTVRTQSAMPVE